MMFNINKAVVAMMLILVALASVDKVAVSADTATTHLRPRRRAKSAKNGDPPPPPPLKSPKKNSKKNTLSTLAPTVAPTEAPTEAPTVAPTEAPTEAPTVAPTEAPTDAPTVPATLSPVAETSGVISGVAAPGPSPVRERKLSADHLTVAEFVEALDDAMEILLDVPATSSCIVESSAIRYAASDTFCTDEFDPVPGSFCYEFQTIISAPDPGDPNCEINEAVEMATEELDAGNFEDAIGGVAGIVEVFVPTDPPTEGPTSGDEPTDAPTSGDDDEPTDAPTSGDDDEPTDAPTSDFTDPPTESFYPTDAPIQP